MNSSNHYDDYQGPSGSGGGENVSRSGRVRKKNSLLAGFESLDALEKPKKKGEKRPKVPAQPPLAKVTLKFGNDTSEPPGKKKGPKKGTKRTKLSHGQKGAGSSSKHSFGRMEPKMNNFDHEEGDLEIDLPPEFDNDIPVLGAEEIIDESLLDSEDSRTEITSNSSNNRLKSQAQSTYMMEKSFEKNRKVTGPGGSGKPKAARKDKGTPRVTAYMLWAKEQRAIFQKKYPLLDFVSISKKLSDLWGTVPQNQKKMWKNRAAKIMRKNANVTENIKNSGPLPSSKKGKKPRGRPRIHPMTSDSDGPDGGRASGLIVAPPMKSPLITKPIVKKPGGNFLAQNEKKPLPNPSVKSSWKPSPAKGRIQKNGSNNNVNATNSVKANVGTSGNKKLKTKSKAHPVEPKSSAKNSLSTMLPSTSFSFTSNKQISPKKEEEPPVYKVTGTSPMDVAAHFALLGESLSVIGERLKDVEGQTVSGSLSVLLDSLLCATGPLLCLSQQVPEFNCIPQEKLTHLLDNIAYVMPGL